MKVTPRPAGRSAAGPEGDVRSDAAAGDPASSGRDASAGDAPDEKITEMAAPTGAPASAPSAAAGASDGDGEVAAASDLGDGGEVVSDGADCAKCEDYLDSLTRLKAEFANFRRRAAERQAQAASDGAADLAARLLVVLDAGEAGAAHHAEAVGPVHESLLNALGDEGLEVISPLGEPFDPTLHEAVMHQPATPEAGDAADAASDSSGPRAPVVTDVLRTGYAWAGRVLRPAVVGVRG